MAENDSATTERLLDLRFLLEEALERARDTTPVGRHAAIVLLDGVCEAATALAVNQAGQHVGGKRFNDLLQAARASYGGSWSAPGLKGVEDLHRVRNLAQHHGIATDPANLTRWAADADRFIRSLVDAAFGRDLREIARSDAIADLELRSQLAEAEHLLVAGDASGAFEACRKTLANARKQWREQWTAASPRPTLHRGPTFGGGFRSDIRDTSAREALERVEAYTEILPFAPNVGEFIWLEGLQRAVASDVPVQPDEAERALSFVFGWILRWEAFSANYTADRIRRWQTSQRPPIVEGRAGPCVSMVEVEEGWWATGETPRLAVHLTVGNPPSGDLETWLRVLGEAVNARWAEREGSVKGGSAPRSGVTVSRDGTVRFPQINEEQAAGLPQLVAAALEDASAAFDQRQEDEARTEETRQRMDADYHTLLSDLLAGDMPLLDDLRVVRHGLSADGFGIQFALAERLPAAVRHAVTNALTEQHGVTEIDSSAEGHPCFRNTRDAAVIAGSLRHALATAQNAFDTEQQRLQEATAARRRLEGHLRDGFNL